MKTAAAPFVVVCLSDWLIHCHLFVHCLHLPEYVCAVFVAAAALNSLKKLMSKGKEILVENSFQTELGD